MYSDKSKLEARKRYLVTSTQGSRAKIRRFSEQLIGGKEYDVHLDEIYKVPSLEDVKLESEEESSDDETFMKPQQQQETLVFHNNAYENHVASVSSSEGSADTESETDSDSDSAEDTDLTFHAPVTLSPATMIRPQRIKKKLERYGEWT